MDFKFISKYNCLIDYFFFHCNYESVDFCYLVNLTSKLSKYVDVTLILVQKQLLFLID